MADQTSLLILADDLTGTADSAIGCTRQGLSTQVMLSASGRVSASANAVAIDLDSRACSPQQAVERHRDCLNQWQGRYRYLFKKIDSTLRGNVAAEIASLVPSAGMAIVAPAYPATGRTTRAGRQWLHERPVEETEVWTNEGIRGRADLVEMLEGAALTTRHLDLATLYETDSVVSNMLRQYQQEGVEAVICDALTDADLRRLAALSATLDGVFWVGSAGLGLVLPDALGLTASTAETPSARAPRRRPTLIVIGSMSGISHVQADALVAANPDLAVVEITPAELFGETEETSSSPALASIPQRLSHRIGETLQTGNDVMVRLAQNEDRNAADGPRLSAELGVMLAPHLAAVDRLIATGGATARAILMAADITRLTLIDAPDTGMARLVTRHGERPLEVITKAGGFGDAEAFQRVWHDAGSATHGTVATHSESVTHFQDSAEDTNMSDRPIIGITMGDAAGVGPEIIVKALAQDAVHDTCRPLVIGDAGRLRQAMEIVGSPLELHVVDAPAQARFERGTLECIDLGLIPADLPWGKVSPIAGDAAYQYIAKTVELIEAGELDAICTAPLNKEALHAGGHLFPGHTELLAHLTGTEEVSMMLVTPKMKVIHVTTHMGIIDAIARIEPGLVTRTIERAHETLARAGQTDPRIAVCGINPHAGENGLFGYGEEEEKIVPAIEALRQRGWNVEGPLPADTLFFRAGRGDFDCVVAMYHDQGHGPVKVMGLEAGVNVTVGLPVVRTSVDHGTAFDIAGKGIADDRSLIEALRQAVELASRQTARSA
ncbi:4-hydroxythreonine-4-phosphate dehydrogenase PdxA [Salinicola halophyticus]|uniref:4-hydroxythreonine-4-phosphate dehydrogenase PdxA n=1 Tax=Salinicola halophyticus TaxID=1808881 RepID=UPI000DA240DA|nr:4-hydroxythreonine-4-phosphate dehydrogenase PdxA [Salinicola halophyticus]